MMILAECRSISSVCQTQAPLHWLQEATGACCGALEPLEHDNRQSAPEWWSGWAITTPRWNTRVFAPFRHIPAGAERAPEAPARHLCCPWPSPVGRERECRSAMVAGFRHGLLLHGGAWSL